MRKFLLVLVLVLGLLPAFCPATAQRFISEKSHVSFYSKAPMEDIEAHNYKAKSIFDAGTGEIVFTVPINTFEFRKSLMQEHFNEKYLESHKYPRAGFKGAVVGFGKESQSRQVTAKGVLEIHGVSREVTIEGELEFAPDAVTVRSRFPVRVADYDIRIPKLVASNIAEVVDVNIEFIYKPYENP